MNYGYLILGVGAGALIIYAGWKYMSSAPQQHQDPAADDGRYQFTGKDGVVHKATLQPTPKHIQPTQATTSASTGAQTHTTPSGSTQNVDYNRLNSIVSYWRSTHPNATQAEIDEEYRVELWNNTKTK